MNHTWRHKSTHQQICSRCGQVRRWNGTRWLYRKHGELVRQRPTCGEKRTDSERYAELRALVAYLSQGFVGPDARKGLDVLKGKLS